MASTALDDIRVLDLSRVLAAPLCTQWLADLGAEVIKVERPGTGDESRTYGPPFVRDDDGNPTDTAAFYLSCNRNKQSITIDHSTEDGQRLIKLLVAQSDVLVENFRSGVLKKYGLDYDSLRAINPRLIYLSVTGFGQTGPYAQRPGYDGIFQAMSGMMSVSGYPEEPMKVGVSMIDILTSLFGATGILAALHHRDRTGEGQHIDLSLLDCGLASLSHFVMNYLVSGTVPTRRGNGGFGGVPSQSFQCADKPIFIVAGNNKQFEALCKAAGRMDIFEDSRFGTTAGRIENRASILAVLDEVFKSKTRDEWISLLDAADVPASPINEMAEVFANPQIQHREMLACTIGDTPGSQKTLANPIRLSATPIGTYTAPPQIGANTDKVLNQLVGMADAEIEKLRANGVI